MGQEIEAQFLIVYFAIARIACPLNKCTCFQSILLKIKVCKYTFLILKIVFIARAKWIKPTMVR